MPESKMLVLALVESLGEVVNIAFFSCRDQCFASYHKFEKSLSIFFF
jgi:hypothetical protein